jgi:hypothetical protein
MGRPDPPNLKVLTDDVKSELAGLYKKLRRSPYRDDAVQSLHVAVTQLCDLIQEEISNYPGHALERGVRQALSSLRSVEGCMQLLKTVSTEYKTAQDITEKHQIQETWVDRELRLVDQADLCARSLDIVGSFADDIARPTVSSDSGEETQTG